MTENNQKESRYSTKSPSRGGVRVGAGRPKGSKDRVTVTGILEALEAKTNGKTYEEILIEDFISARFSGDTQLIHKYHTLLSNKFIANLTDITVENVGDDAETKRLAFLQALDSLKLINKSKDAEDGQ